MRATIPEFYKNGSGRQRAAAPTCLCFLYGQRVKIPYPNCARTRAYRHASKLPKKIQTTQPVISIGTSVVKPSRMYAYKSIKTKIAENSVPTAITLATMFLSNSSIFPQRYPYTCPRDTNNAIPKIFHSTLTLFPHTFSRGFPYLFPMVFRVLYLYLYPLFSPTLSPLLLFDVVLELLRAPTNKV